MTLLRISAASAPFARQPGFRPKPIPGNSALVGLQRSAGNAAVVQYLGQLQKRSPRRRVLIPIQRCGTTPCDDVDEERADVQQVQRCGPTPCDCSDAERTDHEARHGENTSAAAEIAVQRNADDDLAEYIGKDLATYAASHANPYAHIRGVFDKLDPGIQDNVAAEFTKLQNSDQLEVYAASPDGLAMLNAMTEAMITGHVTSFETLQANRILSAKGRSITPTQHAREATRIAKLRHKAEDSVNELMINTQAMRMAQSMTGMVATQQYSTVTKIIRDVGDSVEDNIAAHLIELLTTPQLEAAALVPAGRTMLDVCYDAIITGSVTEFERLQGDRILEARVRSSGHGGAADALQNPTVFPIATAWGSTATIIANLQADGTVKVYYDTKTGARQPQFKRALDTLSRRFGDDKVFNGMILRPDEVVMVQLFNQDEAIVAIPAIKLIDYFNQQQEDFIGKVETVAILGATAGLGGVGGAGILGWADTVAFAISAGSIFINAYRKDIAKTAGGKLFLEAWDMAEGIANVYGWGRLGVDGLRLVQAKVAPALRRWRAETPNGLNAAERNTIAQAQQQTEEWLEGVRKAETTEIAKAEAGATKKSGTEPKRQPADVEPAKTNSAKPTRPPKAPDASKVVTGGHSEIHVTRDRIVVCQLCPDLHDAVGGAITNKGVAGEVADAERAAARGQAAGAAAKAETAVLDAEKVNARTHGQQKVRYQREFVADPTLAKEWKRIKGMKSGPNKAAAVRDLEQRAGQLKVANDRQIESIRQRAEKLRAAAKDNPAAGHDLKALYEAQPEWLLRELKRIEDEAIKAMPKPKRGKKGEEARNERNHRPDSVLNEEIKRKKQLAQDAKWAEVEFRTPHEAEVWVNGKAGKRLRDGRYTSGGVKDIDVAEHGFNEANTRSHTEAKALRELGVHPGETMYINGRYDPCRFCVARMQKAVDTFGGTVVYLWPGGPKGGARFFKGSGTAAKLKATPG